MSEQSIELEKPNLALVGVFSLKELYQPSGVDDMTNLEFIEFFEGAINRAQSVFISMNGLMPRDAHEHNKKLYEQGISSYGADSPYLAAVISRRPPILHA